MNGESMIDISTATDIEDTFNNLPWNKKLYALSLPTSLSSTDKEREKDGKNNSSMHLHLDVPCGQCPAVQLCRPGGDVNPDSCRMMQKWLEGIARV